MTDDERNLLVTLDSVMGYVWTALAGVGALAAVLVIVVWSIE